MKKIHTAALIMGLCLAVPFASQAGMGIYITIKNELNTGADRPNVTIHINNGSSCWYDYGLADWAQYAKPGESVKIYTERTESGACFGQPGIRGLGLFAGGTIVPWVPIWKGKAGPNDFKIVNGQLQQTPAIGQDLGYGICVKSYTDHLGRPLERSSDGAILLGANYNTTYGTITVAACNTLKASAADSNIPVANDELVTPSPDSIPAPTNSYVNPKPIHVKVGQIVNVTVPTKYLNSDTEWDLGGCSTDGAIQNLQFNHNKKGQRLAETLQITGVTPGSLTCALNANDYDEIGNVWPVVQQIFNVIVH